MATTGSPSSSPSSPGPPPAPTAPRFGESVWRRYGESLFAFLAMAIFVVEGAALGYLTWTLLFRSGPDAFQLFGLRDALVGTVALTAVSVAVITGSVVVFRSASARREIRRSQEVTAWTESWRRIMQGEAELPRPPLPAPAVAALLDLREELSGPEAGRATALIAVTGVDRLLLERLAAIPGAGHGRLSFRLPGGSHRLSTSLETLDDLAKARLPEAIPSLLTLFGRHERSIRRMAVRAATRSIAAMPPGPERDAFAMSLLEDLISSGFGRGVLDEALLLLEGAAEPLITAVLDSPSAGPVLVASCLDSVGRLGLSSLADQAGRRLAAGQAVDVHAAALRCLASLSILPESARPDLRAALASDREIERTQAARAAYLLPADESVPVLEGLLGDRSWWVRRAAAEGLLRVTDEGVAALRRATREHPDRFGRDMAAQVLRDEGIAVPGPGERADVGAGATRR